MMMKAIQRWPDLSLPPQAQSARAPGHKVASQEGPLVPVGPQCTLLGPPHTPGSTPSFLAILLSTALIGPDAAWNVPGRTMGA